MSYPETYKSFKINILKYQNKEDKTVIDKIYIFTGHNNDQLQQHFEAQRNINDKIFDSIFSDEERSKININTSIQFVNSYIHYDDTIQTIKKKIIQIDNTFSLPEIYLFAEIITTLNIDNTYKELTINNSTNLNELTLHAFLQNFPNKEDQNIITPPTKSTYDYNDLISTKIGNTSQYIYTPIGQSCNYKNAKYHYTVNPYNVGENGMDYLLSKNWDEKSSIISTKNRELLFNVGSIRNNVIYLCQADDVLKFVEKLPSKDNWNQQLFIKIYYPFLLKDNITNLQLLNKKKTSLRKETQKQKKDFNNYNKNVDLFYDIFYQNNIPIEYDSDFPKGISTLHCIMHPKKNIKFPLEIIFKLIHATKHIPFIKYNPGGGKEKIYRLFVGNLIAKKWEKNTNIIKKYYIKS